ncbi:LOW QUALITY PROTEIN: ileal sodium/bile acid cotransporter [Aphomia sociella]
MCPIWPLHLIIIYLLALCPLWVVCQTIPELMANFTPDDITVHMDDSEYVDLRITGTGMQVGDTFRLESLRDHITTGDWNSTYSLTEENTESNSWEGKVRVNGNFLGRTNLTVEVVRNGVTYPVFGALPVTVIRPVRVIDTIFTSSVATFVSIIYINFGCAMHWPTVKDVLKRPIGPAIGMIGQFLFMPLMSFGLGFLIFPNNSEMRLGMFFTGVSRGGASNIWTFILGGNLNLSLAMTSISTFAAFGLMPMWLFSLGQVVFSNANIVVPYQRIGTFVVGLIVPLAIGLGMQRWTPRLAAFMVRILKGFSTTLLLFIIVFAIITNLYIFELFTWRIILAGIGIPWLGYGFGYMLARVLKQPHPDALAISIETGVQNTGISIFLLRYALEQPEADLTTVVPVAVAIMTPIPMTAIYIYQKIRGCIARRNEPKKIVEDITPVSEGVQPNVVATIDVEK